MPVSKKRKKNANATVAKGKWRIRISYIDGKHPDTVYDYDDKRSRDIDYDIIRNKVRRGIKDIKKVDPK